MQLHNNQDVNWNGQEYFFDENGQAHAQHLHWGNDYTLEDGDLTDDINALSDGVIFYEADIDELFD